MLKTAYRFGWENSYLVPIFLILSSWAELEVVLQMKCKKENPFISENVKIQHYYIGHIFPPNVTSNTFYFQSRGFISNYGRQNENIQFPILQAALRRQTTVSAWVSWQNHGLKSKKTNKNCFNLFSVWVGIPERQPPPKIPM